MSTAIVRAYTEDGFVVASDGLVRGSDDGKILHFAKQKIFSFGGARSLAFSFTGSIELGTRHRAGVVFDFIAAVSAAVQSRSATRHRTLTGYAQRISRIVHDSLKTAQLADNIPFTSDPSETHAGMAGFTIATVLIDGYLLGTPSRAEIRFSHNDQQLADPEVFSTPITTQLLIYGSPEVSRLFPSDPRFEQYRTRREEPWHTSPLLSRAINNARCMIEAQGSQEARDIDDQICAGIGGRTQIATITPRDGFQWVPELEPLPP